MKIIIYITALICSLLASPVLATETGQISMTDMGLKSHLLLKVLSTKEILG